MNSSSSAKTATNKEKESALAANLRSQIKSRMESMGVNVRALERKAGLNTGAVNNILHGASANPTAETLNALANAFECTIDDLLGRKGNQVTYTSSETKFKNFQPYEWHHSLYISIIDELKKQLSKKQLSIDAEKALYLINEVYFYSLKKQKETADESLIEWLLDKAL
jgi:transcriptional regulator with XRE-family HTH domain